MSQVEVVQQIYAAFGRGDVPSILAHLSPDVDWEYGGSTDGAPWLIPRRGRHGAGEFFQSLAGLNITKFVPKTFLTAPGLVVVLLDLEATVAATGKRVVEEDEVHIWRFNDRNEVTRFRHRADTLQHWRATR